MIRNKIKNPKEVTHLRVLRFIVNGQSLDKDLSCDFSGLVPGTDGYVTAEFEFSPDWDGCVKVASFYSVMGTEYKPQFLEGGRRCMIPKEALEKRAFKVQVIGRCAAYTLTTNKVIVRQNGGNT